MSGHTASVEFESDETYDWATLNPAKVIADFDWLAAHRGAKGSERRVLLSIRLRDGNQLHLELRPETAREMAQELRKRVDADEPPSA